MLLAAGIIFLVLPILAVTLYVFYCGKKQKNLLKLFKSIRDEFSNTRKEAADRAIQILHGNQWLFPPKPILLNIQDLKDLAVSYEILKAEIRFLLKTIDAIRNQKKYLTSLSPNERSEVLKFRQTLKYFLENLDFMPLNRRNKVKQLIAAYQAALVVYLSLPDENAHRELNFIPLFAIIDKTPVSTLILFPEIA
ncbi:MAG: hypothetical protein HYY86_03110 [Candidatus Harrisonbacteria bacterium]|nr:hypothetical protein [Candidatus Harrisonbacteria bacterium]